MDILIGVFIGAAVGFILRSVMIFKSAVGTIRIFSDDDGDYMRFDIAKGKLRRLYTRGSVVVNIEKFPSRK